MRGRRVVVGAAIALALVGGACSDDDDDSASTTTTLLGPGLAATGEAMFDGALVAAVPFELQYPTTIERCANLVAADVYVVPLPSQVGDATLAWQAATPNLRGAGTYGLSDFDEIRVTVVRGGGEPVEYTSGDGTTATLELRPDGGGTFDVAGLRDAAGVELRSSSAWTCGDREAP